MTNFIAASAADGKNDLAIPNKALYFEHQGIWAYEFAIEKLSKTALRKAILKIALENQTDRKQHREILSAAIRDLEGTPVQPQPSYDLSSYFNKREGNVDNDVNIAKFALALETDAAIAYATETTKLKIPSLIRTGAGIGSIESAHAARIRATFSNLGIEIPVIPSAVLSQDNRDLWILKVSR